MSDDWTQAVMMAVMLGVWILIGDRGDRLALASRLETWIDERIARRKERRDFPRARVRR